MAKSELAGSVVGCRDGVERLIDPHASRFTEALTHAIAAYTRDQCRENSAALNYRGIDLAPVIERHLFFAAINDKVLYEAFKLKDTSAHLSGAANVLRPYLFEDRRNVSSRLAAAGHGLVSRLSDRLGASARPPMGDAEVTFRNGAEGCDLLFHVGAEKFLRYLKPVADRFGERAAFLVHDAPELLSVLIATGLPIVSINALQHQPPLGRMNPALKEWTVYCSYHDALRIGLQRVGCKCVVLAEGNSPQNALIAGAARALRIRSVCIQQGWSPIVHTGFRNLRYDVMCVWGDLFADLLRAHNRSQRFLATGHHLLRLSNVPQVDARSAVGFFLQKDSRLITDGAWLAMLRFVAWAADRFPDRAILVREHPGAPLTREEIALFAGRSNVKLVPPATMPLADVLVQCCAAVSMFSTTLIEAVGAGVVPLIVNLTGMERFCPDLAAAGAGIEVKDMEAARSGLSEILMGKHPEMPSAMKALRHRLFVHTEGEALGRIVSAIQPASAVPGMAKAAKNGVRATANSVVPLLKVALEPTQRAKSK